MFTAETSDGSLEVFDDSHKIDMSKFKSFGTTIGINYNSRSKGDLSKREKIRSEGGNGDS